jgi:hypothetical protein
MTDRGGGVVVGNENAAPGQRPNHARDIGQLGEVALRPDSCAKISSRPRCPFNSRTAPSLNGQQQDRSSRLLAIDSKPTLFPKLRQCDMVRSW